MKSIGTTTVPTVGRPSAIAGRKRQRSTASMAARSSSRELLLREANGRLRQALEVADICLTTADQLEKTLTSYQALLRGTVPAAASHC